MCASLVGIQSATFYYTSIFYTVYLLAQPTNISTVATAYGYEIRVHYLVLTLLRKIKHLPQQHMDTGAVFRNLTNYLNTFFSLTFSGAFCSKVLIEKNQCL